MDDDELERALQQRFEALRRDDARRAPAFAAMMAQARESLPSTAPADGSAHSHSHSHAEHSEYAEYSGDSRTTHAPAAFSAPRSGTRARRTRWLLWTMPLAVAAGAAVVMIQSQRHADDEFEHLVSEWSRSQSAIHSPTDRLLSLPGSEYLRGTPMIGAPTIETPPAGASRPRSPS